MGLPDLDKVAAMSRSWPDRYRNQYSATVAWYRAILRDLDEERARAWTGTEESVLALRTQLRDRSGAEKFCGRSVDSKIFEGEPQRYRVWLDDGRVYCGRVWAPKNEQQVRGPLVVVSTETERETAALASAYSSVGRPVIVPDLAMKRESHGKGVLGGAKASFYDDEYTHLLAWGIGGTLIGMEAAELKVVTEAIGNLIGLPGGRVAFDLRGRSSASGVVAAALWPGLVDTLVVCPEVSDLDDPDQRGIAQLIWGYQRYFDVFILLMLARGSRQIFREKLGEPSALWARVSAARRNGPERDDLEGRVERWWERDAGDQELAASVCGTDGSDAVGARVKWIGSRSLKADERDQYVESMASKWKFLDALHERATQRTTARWKELEADPANYKKMARECRERLLGARPKELKGPASVDMRMAEQCETHERHEVVLTVESGVETCGYLLLPRSQSWRLRQVKPPWPAVIILHGRDGRPDAIVGTSVREDEWIYDRAGERLAQRGYVVFAPFLNWGWGERGDRDMLARLAVAAGCAPNLAERLQLAAALQFVRGLACVDKGRVALYGLSYGAHAALWFGSELTGIAALVISGHLTDWSSKLYGEPMGAPVGFRPFIHAGEGIDMFYFNVLNELGHAQLLAANAPVPTFVESGTEDEAFPAEAALREWGIARHIYERLNAGELAQIGVYPGPHRIWGDGSYGWLDERLRVRQNG